MHRARCPKKTTARAGPSRSGASAFSTIRPYPDYPPAAMGDRGETPALRMWVVDQHLTVTSIIITESSGRSEGVQSLGTGDVALPHRAPSTKAEPPTDVFHSEVQHG